MTEPSPHLDLDALADALAGEGGDTAHLSSCASCTSRLAELQAAEARVVSVLSTLPPPQLPPDLADRLSAALAAEAPVRADASATVTPLASRRPRRNWLPAAAAAVLLASGAGLGVALLNSGSGRDTAGTAALDSAAAGPDLILNSSGTDYSDAAAVTDVLPRVLKGEAGEVALAYGTAAGTDAGTAGGTAEGPAAETRSDDQAAATMSDPQPQTLEAADPLALLRTPEGLASCLAGVLADEPDTEPVALDYARFGGQPALAVLLPDPDPTRLSVFLVGPGCSQADAQVLHFVRVPRP